MNATTHAVFGVAALAGASLTLGTEPPVYAYPVAGVAAWLPDLDNPRSRLGNGLSPLKNPLLNAATRPVSLLLRAISFTLFKTVGHRTLTHSLLGLIFFGLLLFPLSGPLPDVFLALVAGYASHLFSDALNTRGVPLFWPVGGSFRLLPGGVRSGGVAELAVAAVAVVVCGVLIYLLYPALGGALRSIYAPFEPL